MNKDLEKIIHETAREIAVAMFQKSNIDKSPIQEHRDSMVNEISKMASEAAIQLHWNAQRLINSSPEIPSPPSPPLEPESRNIAP